MHGMPFGVVARYENEGVIGPGAARSEGIFGEKGLWERVTLIELCRPDGWAVKCAGGFGA